MTRRRHAVLFIAALLIAALALSACGVRPDSSPRSLVIENVPYGLLDEGPVEAPRPTVPPAARVNVTVFFLAGEHLQAAPRRVPEPATPNRAIVALLAGPSEDEAIAGLRTAINPATEILVTRPSPDVVSVDLSAAFAAVPTQEQRFALAQIVFTATAVTGVAAVRFTLAGAPVEVPLPDGTASAGPVGRDAFASLAPPQPDVDPPRPS